jgi:hypothetical protein
VKENRDTTVWIPKLGFSIVFNIKTINNDSAEKYSPLELAALI